jgi:4-diphosphocytidyl-2-C-methyl-D-erythritol kinase
VIASIKSPAKINLGLEILNKRADGYHEIRTILQMIDLADDISVRFSNEMRIACSDPALAQSDNLALRAARRWSEEVDPDHRNLHIELDKRIPAAAGLGGASSNAASVVILATELVRFENQAVDQRYEPMTAPERSILLHDVAAELGSDVPFFLGEAAAFAHGRGELLDAVKPLGDVWIVLATPNIEIERKTATMYGALDPELDFTDGSIISDNRDRLNQDRPLPAGHLFNAFARPLLALYPQLERIAEIMGFYADGRTGLSGAGPTWYALVETDSAARALSGALTANMPTARIVTGRPLSRPETVAITPGA